MSENKSRKAISKYEFRDVVSGDYTQATTDSESSARALAAQKIDADPTDLRRIYEEDDYVEQ